MVANEESGCCYASMHRINCLSAPVTNGCAEELFCKLHHVNMKKTVKTR